MSLADVLAAAASELEDVSTVAGDGRTEWHRVDVTFAVLAGETAEFRLDPLLVRAALGTSDTTRSTRGPDWVAFAPPELDRTAIDRASAWFASAWRRAAD